MSKKWQIELKSHFKENWLVYLVFVVAIALVVAPYIRQFSEFGVSTQTESWGDLGDYIGGVAGTVFSGLAFILLAISVRVQQKQIALMQTQINDDRELQKQQIILSALSIIAENRWRTLENTIEEYRRFEDAQAQESGTRFHAKLDQLAEFYDKEAELQNKTLKVMVERLYKFEPKLRNELNDIGQ